MVSVSRISISTGIGISIGIGIGIGISISIGLGFGLGIGIGISIGISIGICIVLYSVVQKLTETDRQTGGWADKPIFFSQKIFSQLINRKCQEVSSTSQHQFSHDKPSKICWVNMTPPREK